MRPRAGPGGAKPRGCRQRVLSKPPGQRPAPPQPQRPHPRRRAKNEAPPRHARARAEPPLPVELTARVKTRRGETSNKAAAWRILCYYNPCLPPLPKHHFQAPNGTRTSRLLHVSKKRPLNLDPAPSSSSSGPARPTARRPDPAPPRPARPGPARPTLGPAGDRSAPADVSGDTTSAGRRATMRYL